MAGFQQIKVTKKVDFIGATKVGFPISSLAGIGIGRVYFVDNTYGADGNAGLDPSYPKKTIQAALDVCTDFYNDYVFVSRRATTDYTTTTPILLGAHTTHLIGLSNATPQGALIRLVHTNETDNVLEIPQDEGYHNEIAGFGFAGGTTAKGGICATGSGGGCTGVWIHHCNFGGLLTKGTPDYGIFCATGQEMQAWTIEDCSFYGSGNNSKGLIGVDGIMQPTAGSSTCKHLIIRNNIFMGIPGVAISLASVSGAIIFGNQFSLDAETSGAAITLASTCLGCWVSWNDSNFGSTNAMTNGGYRDLAAGDANNWSSNWCGGEISYPASS